MANSGTNKREVYTYMLPWWYWGLVLPIITAFVLLLGWMLICHFWPNIFSKHIFSIASVDVVVKETSPVTQECFFEQISTFYSTVIVVLLAIVTLVQIAATMYYGKMTSYEAERILSEYTTNGPYKNKVLEIWNKEIDGLVDSHLSKSETRDLINQILSEGKYFDVLRNDLRECSKRIQLIEKELLKDRDDDAKSSDTEIITLKPQESACSGEDDRSLIPEVVSEESSTEPSLEN